MLQEKYMNNIETNNKLSYSRGEERSPSWVDKKIPLKKGFDLEIIFKKIKICYVLRDSTEIIID